MDGTAVVAAAAAAAEPHSCLSGSEAGVRGASAAAFAESQLTDAGGRHFTRYMCRCGNTTTEHRNPILIAPLWSGMLLFCAGCSFHH